MRRIASALLLNRTHMQVFLGFLIVMAIVLSVSGGYLYKNVSALMIANAKDQIGETANQASARLDALLAQVDTLTLQLAMDSRIQEALLAAQRNGMLPVDDRLSLRPMIDNMIAFSWAIQSIELYAGSQPLYPLDLPGLDQRVGSDIIRAADERRGRLVWRSLAQEGRNQLVAVRQIPLEQNNLKSGGYFVVWVDPSILDFLNAEFSSIRGRIVHLYDENGISVAASRFPAEPEADADRPEANGRAKPAKMEASETDPAAPGGDYLRIERKSAETSWSIVLLVPKQAITGGLQLFKQALLWSLAVGTATCLLLMSAMSGLITRPIRRLRRTMHRFAHTLPQPNNENYFNFEMNELNQSYNKLVRELHHLVATVYEKERLKNKAEIRMLQAQIHPHFLFNTLDSLYWNLIGKGEREGAAMVSALSKLFRYSIKSSGGDDWAALADEIEHAKRYLDIMKYRLGDRLTWSCETDPDCLNARIPKLLIQPLIENAVYHGIEPKLGEGHLSVSVRKTAEENGQALQIQVADNGPGIESNALMLLRQRLEQTVSPAETVSPGLGLLNVQQRIRLFFGEPYGLTIDSIPGKGTTVTIKLPDRSHAS